MRQIILPNSYNYVSAFLTFRCNLDCGFCVNRASNTHLKRNKFREISGKKWVESLNRITPPEGVPYSLVGGEPSLHKDFIYIVNNLNPDAGLDLVTNLWWSDKKIKKFIAEIDPKKIDNHAPFPSIRASYHPEEMGSGDKLLENAIKLKEAGFDIGLEGVMYPKPSQLEAIEEMILKCKKNDLSFRPKSFIGVYEGKDDLGNNFSITYGKYKYEGSVFNENLKNCLCKTSNLYLGPDGNNYKCQRDLLLGEYSIGNITDPSFKFQNDFLPCDHFGQCHPCDVKVKTNNQQEMQTTMVKIKDVTK